MRIDHRTYAVIPSFIEPYRSEIITEEGRFFSEQLPLQLMEAKCLETFSTVEGRRKAVQHHLSFEKKTPLLLEPCTIGAFPTHSMEHPECMYIFQHPLTIEEKSSFNRIHFPNGDTLDVSVSMYILQSQYARLHMMLSYCKQFHGQPYTPTRTFTIVPRKNCQKNK